jgi:amino acid adenylation domain-containing protein
MVYEELERESSQLAARLRKAGARPERCVGILLERSSDFVIAALATLKSGAAYLPLDPSTPSARAAYILDDAAAVALLTHSRLVDDLPKGPWSVITSDSGNVPPTMPLIDSETDLNSLAYVVYTSGSTGRPKGVEITHGNLCNLIEWHQAAFAVTAADRASQVAGLGFDAAGWEIWPYLTAGASVHIADEATRRSPELLRDWIVAQRITIGFVPTIIAEQMFHADWAAETALRVLLTGGDTLRRRPPAGLPFAVINNYGPTECAVVATSGTVCAENGSPEWPSIGRPISGAAAHILDDALRPVVPGEAGELCMSGALVGRGYRNTPELTASQFVTYIAASGERLRIYRTGDRVRSLENGEIEFLGRFDDQVKIRGYRIELGEVVACLNGCPGIEASAVCVLETGEAGLVAYIVPAADALLADSDVRRHLAARLPDYMIPTVFVPISALPLSPNGKLDRSALPTPASANLLQNPSDAQRGSSQSDPLQHQIAAMVASLLGRASVAEEENFFMAGGHSMLGVQLVARIRDAFGVKLTLRQLFKAPTVAALSAEVARLTNVV